MDRKDLIARGYFPKELPPPFNTTTLSNYSESNQSSAPLYLKHTAKLYSYNHARYSSLRRRLSIPHPVFFIELCSSITNSWTEIDSITKRSRFSRSKPTHTPLPKRTRSISPFLEFSFLPAERAKNRISGRYVLKTDISQFYQSIYTHSIPWAIHGKAIAKKRRNDTTLLGNKLDKLLRDAQDGQTQGIPIGPDTSLVIAELILCTSDVELEDRLRGLCRSSFRGFRYSDDYEFVFQSISDAESALSQIQQVLSRFELTINPEKTRIEELPCSLDSAWVLEVSSYDFSTNELVQMQDIIRYFDKAFKLASQFPTEPVLKYAISKMSRIDINSNNWSLLESLLLQSISIDPSTLRDSLSIIQDKQKRNYKINSEALEEILNLQVIRYSALGYSSEVAWAIWSLIVFNLPITKLAAESASKMEDSVVALLTLDAYRRGKISEGLNTLKWEQFMVEEELYGQQWLLSYEANKQGYLPNGKDHVSKDSWFSALKKADVAFYNRSTPLIIPPSENSGPSGKD